MMDYLVCQVNFVKSRFRHYNKQAHGVVMKSNNQ